MSDRDDTSDIGDLPGYYGHLDFNAPLSDRRAAGIVSRLSRSAPRAVLDVGCGWGELLLRVLEACRGANGVGLDTDGRCLERGRAEADARGLAERASFVEAPAEGAREMADVILCVGSSHAWGGTGKALAHLRGLLRPGGRLVLGDAIWTGPAAVDPALVPDDLPQLPDLPGLVEVAIDAGFRPVFIEEASLGEWDAFESGYLADWEEWLVEHPEHPDADRVRASADEHRDRWLRGYRGSLGFAYLTLGGV